MLKQEKKVRDLLSKSCSYKSLLESTSNDFFSQLMQLTFSDKTSLKVQRKKQIKKSSSESKVNSVCKSNPRAKNISIIQKLLDSKKKKLSNLSKEFKVLAKRSQKRLCNSRLISSQALVSPKPLQKSLNVGFHSQSFKQKHKCRNKLEVNSQIKTKPKTNTKTKIKTKKPKALIVACKSRMEKISELLNEKQKKIEKLFDTNERLLSSELNKQESFSDICNDSEDIKDVPSFHTDRVNLLEAEITDSEPELPFEKYDIEAEYILRLEISNYIEAVSQSITERKVDNSFEYIGKLINIISLDLSESLASLLPKNPLDELHLIRNRRCACKPVQLYRHVKAPYIAFIKKLFNPSLERSNNVYIRLLVDCIDEACSLLRTIQPFLWSKIYDSCRSRPNINDLLSLLLHWNLVKIGEMHENIELAEIIGYRNKRLNDILEFETKTEEWTDYEDEELQVVCDTSDLVLDFLLTETVLSL